MKNIYKSIALICMGLASVACVEENLEPNNGRYDTTPGNDIQFTATAQMDDASGKNTKTEYGDINEDRDKIDINWTAGDKIQIASLEAAARQTAEYEVIFDKKEDGDDAGTSADYTGSHTAKSLEKTGDAALQWSEADTYNFYAMYPSPASFTTDEEKKHVNLMISENEKVMTAWLPTTQISESHTTPNTGSQIVKPNMKYAYMHAASSYSKSDADGNPNQKGISLQFEPAVTALQFDITVNTIANQGQDANGQPIGEYITIKSVSLKSDSGSDVCGEFTYNFTTKQYAKSNTGTGYDRVTMSFGDGGYKLVEKESLDVTFFLLPQDFDAGDLQLEIWFSIGTRTQAVVRTATIKTAIQARKKYCFNDLLMPKIAADVEGSNWGSALDPDTYLTQISVPVAGNAFSSYYNGTDIRYNREQVHDYLDLWNMGVRGFEFKCAQGSEANTGISAIWNPYKYFETISDEYFVTNGQEMKTNGAPNFDTAFTNLASLLLTEEYKNEFLVILATYQSYSGCGGYDPQDFINDLGYYLKNKSITSNGKTVKVWDDMMVKLASNSIVNDIKGKIAVLVRPADQEFIDYANISYSSLSVGDYNKLMLVDNWGTSVDCWDRRYDGYNRQKVFGRGTDGNADGTIKNTYIENYLYAIASNNSGEEPTIPTSNGAAFKDGYPESELSPDLFQFNNGTYFIQEFARVVPVDEELNNGFYSDISDNASGQTRYLWIRWPESITEKKSMIDYTMLASMSSLGKSEGVPLYINSLAGYYVTQNHDYSYYPYAGSYILGEYEFKLDDAGMGGDIAGLAADLNVHLYNSLIAADKYHQQGPLGLVIMNYIGAEESHFTEAESEYIGEDGHETASDASIASKALPNMILMNNFKFPLTQKPDNGGTTPPQPTSYDATYVNGGEAISFE